MKLSSLKKKFAFISNIKRQNKFKKISKENNIDISKPLLSKIYLNIEGKNNTVIIKNGHIGERLNINIFGDNNKIIIDENFSISKRMTILIGQNHPNFGKANNASFELGENTTIEGLTYITYNSNAYCKIGKNCMIAYGVTLFNTDAHPIFDKDTNELLNKVEGIEIKEHCWIGMNATILKNSFVPKNSILGYGCVYSGKKNIENAIYAGNPAKLIKENINWDSNGNKYGYIENV